MYHQTVVNQQQDASRHPMDYGGYSSPNNISNYPIHPDVHLKKLAFFDSLGTLLKPSTLIPSSTQRLQESNYFFHLTPSQASDIASCRDMRNPAKPEHTIQVQLRFCLLESSCEQDDYFPPNILVKVNGKPCQLPNPIPTNKPGVEAKRPPGPVNITPNVKLSPTVTNTIQVSWCMEYGRNFCLSVYLVRKLNSDQLLQRLKSKGIKPTSFTKALIEEKLKEDADCEIATTMLKVSLICPLGKMRMTTPCRASTCLHLQCFDANLYLQMNERKPTWNCPVCDKPAIYENLVIDGYFQDVLESSTLGPEDNEIQLHQDGSWSNHIQKPDTLQIETPVKAAQKVEIISLDLDGGNDSTPSTTTAQSNINMLKMCLRSNNGQNGSSNGNGTNGTAVTTTEPTSTTNESVVDLTLSDSEDDMPLRSKKQPTTRANVFKK